MSLTLYDQFSADEGKIAFKAQSARGTLATGTYKGTNLVSANYKENRTVVQPEPTIGGSIYKGKAVGLGIACELDARARLSLQNFLQFFSMFCGHTATGDGTTAPYTTTWTPYTKANQFPWYSVACEVGYQPDGITPILARDMVDTRIKSLHISGQANQIMLGDIGIEGIKGVLQDTVSPPTLSLDPGTTIPLITTGSVTLPSFMDSGANLISFDWSWANEMKGNYGVTKVARTSLVPTNAIISLQATVELQNGRQYSDIYYDYTTKQLSSNVLEGALNLTVQTPYNIGSAPLNVPFSLEFLMPDVQWTVGLLDLKPGEIVTIQLTGNTYASNFSMVSITDLQYA